MKREESDADRLFKVMIFEGLEHRRKGLYQSRKAAALWLSQLSFEYLELETEQQSNKDSKENPNKPILGTPGWKPPLEDPLTPFRLSEQKASFKRMPGLLSLQDTSHLDEKQADNTSFEEDPDPVLFSATGKTTDRTEAQQVKLFRLSSGIIERFAKSGTSSVPWETLFEKVCRDRANWGKGYSESENKCLLYLRNNRKRAYVHNKVLFWNEALAGTPDGVFYGHDKRIVEVAEFKSIKSQTSNKRQERHRLRTAILQLHVHFEVTGASLGVIVFHNEENETIEVVEVAKDQKIISDIYEGRVKAFEKMRQQAEKNPSIMANILEKKDKQ